MIKNSLNDVRGQCSTIACSEAAKKIEGEILHADYKCLLFIK